jgi:hypothetical protein
MLSCALLLAMATSAWAQQRPTPLKKGDPAPWTGILVPRKLLEASLVDELRLQHCEEDLQHCRASAPILVEKVVEAVPPCPEPSAQSLERPWLGWVLAGTSGMALGAVLGVLAIGWASH